MNTSCDVLVVGAGVAGTAAAVAAARSGIRTVLVEKEQYLGGTGYAGMFQHICGLYLNGTTMPQETLNPGIAREITALLSRASPHRTIKKIGQVYVLPYRRDELQSVLLSLCDAEGSLTVLRQSTAAGVEMGSGAIKSVAINRPDEQQTITARMVIDCTGDGYIAALAGAGFELAPLEQRQLAGFTVHVKGLKNADEMLAIKVPYYLAQAVQKGKFAPSARFTTFSLGEADGEGYYKMSIDAGEGPDREDHARKDAVAIHAFLESVLSAFEGSYIAGTSPRVLDREGRRVVGEYTLTQEDVLSAKKFPDGVVKNAWPIELWDRTKGTIYHYVPREDFYEIPLRCIMVKGIGNLLIAGRCISVTHEALGSTRVMGTCMALGEQAGKAAAYRVRNGKYPENIKEY